MAAPGLTGRNLNQQPRKKQHKTPSYTPSSEGHTGGLSCQSLDRAPVPRGKGGACEVQGETSKGNPGLSVCSGL